MVPIMAAIPPARTRSLRAAAPSLNRHQQSSNNASSTTMATATATRRTQAGPESSIQGPSPLSLFMTNLRLLDLDLLPDWPGISAATFSVTGSGTGAAQAQKRRVICVEWALFRLFEIYDAEETRTKLKPFFPPQEQVQSVNLRAALLRGLEAAKKSGVLGKDTILRKTMLDDCRGERLEEVLAAFSTAVLKMVVAEEESMGSSTPAMRLALEGRGYKDDKTDLLVLGLVYRAALNRTLRARNETAAKFRDFEDLLSVKERGVKRRKEEAKALNDVERAQRGNAASKDAAREMRQTVRNNWAGNEQWMDALMYGDAKGRGDDGGPFGMPFERVWRRVEQSRLEELEEGGVGLLEQLERRVRGHEERLAKWERFRDGLRVSTRGPPREKQKVGEDEKGSKGLNLGFGAHESLQVGGVGEKSRGKSVVRLPQAGTTTRHDKFIKDLERDLEQASGTATNPIEALSFLFDRKPAPKATGSLKAPDAEHEASSEISDLEDHDVLNGRHVDDEFSKPIEPRKLEALKTFPVRPKLNYASASALARNSLEDEGEIEAPKKEPLTKSAPKLSRPRTMSSSGEEAQDAPRALPTRTRTMSISRSRTYTRDRSISPEEYQQPEQHIPEYKEEVDTRRTQQKQHMLEDVVVHDDQQPEPISPTQDLADEILENMENASPSPAKPSRPRHKLSLAERTRMSMARGSLLFADDEDQDLEISPHKQASSPSEPLPSTNGEESEPSPPEDLVSRTRRSMAGFEKARQKAQLDRRRSIRKSKAMGPPIKEGSYFPKVHEEEGQSILAEELIGEEDMEAVFKSRPKIKASPIPSPTREWDDD